MYCYFDCVLIIINNVIIVMTGEALKEFLFKKKVSQSEVARQLKISQQSFNQMLSSADVKTSLLERIAKVLNVTISSIYGEKSSDAVANGDGCVAVNGNNTVAHHITTNATNASDVMLQQKVEALEALLAEKERLITVLLDTRK